MSLFVRGFVLGLSIAAAVGPMSLLCIRRTLAHGQLRGLATGLGIASADGVYSAVAAYGLTAVSGLLVGQRMWLQLVGGCFLTYLGVRIVMTPPVEGKVTVERTGLAGAYGSALALTLTNPMTILSFAAIFAGTGLLQSGPGMWAPTRLVAGLMLGSAGWWLMLTTAVAGLRHRLPRSVLVWLNRLSGSAICAFGLLALIALLR